MGKHSKKRGISYWETRERRKDLRNRGKQARRKGTGLTIWVVAFLVIGLAIGGALGFYAKPIGKLGARIYLSFKQKQWQPKGTEKKKVEKALVRISQDPNMSVNTLVMGSDSGSVKGEGGWCRSDVMMLVCLQERDKKAVVISIPRDTKVELPGHGTEKINAAHSFGGPSGAIDAVRALTGLDVNHYVSMNFVGFKKIIDGVGGVPIHLDKAINDPHAGYLPAGDQLLDGQGALVVVRSRRLPNGDVDRINSQQAFIKALMSKANGMGMMKQKQLVDVVAGSVQMDYSAGDLMTLADELRGFQLDKVQFVTIPGDSKYINGASYFVANPQALAAMAAQVKQNTEIAPDMIANLQQYVTSTVTAVNPPNADVIKVLSSPKTLASAAVVGEELKLVGHKDVSSSSIKQPVPKTVIYYRREAREQCDLIKKQAPELAGAEVVQNDTYTADYNSPVVVMIADGFQAPGIMSIYGRLLQQAVNVESLGQHFKSFI